MLKLKVIAIVLLVALLSLITYKYVAADWHVGNVRRQAYGAKANIRTPSTAVKIAAAGISNSITLPKPYWVQTGWRYYRDYNPDVPQKYVEYCKDPCKTQQDYFQKNYGTQNWSSTVSYQVEHYAGSYSTWCASIDGILKECAIALPAPTDMFVQGEVHTNVFNEMDTKFFSVYYKNSSGNWLVFDQANWFEQFPYVVAKTYPYQFQVYRAKGVKILFLPIMKK